MELVTVTSNADATVTLTFSKTANTVLMAARTRYGETVLKELIESWLLGRLKLFREESKETLQTKYERLDAAKQEQINAILG